MKKLAALAAAALVAASAMGTTAAEARGRGGAIAAGVIGGLAAGALLGAAVSQAHEAPAYGYARPVADYGYDDAPPPVIRYRPARVVRDYGYEDVPVYRSRRVVRSYDDGPEYDDYRPARFGFRRDCDRPHGYGGW